MRLTVTLAQIKKEIGLRQPVGMIEYYQHMEVLIRFRRKLWWI